MQRAIELEHSGMIMRGMLHRPEDIEGKIPMVLIFHGFTGNKMESHFMFVKLSRRLEEMGIASLRFDFLGSGESDGEFKDMTLSGELEDAEAILEFAQSLDWVDRDNIYVVGLSMGGAVASMLAGKYSDNIRKLCLWAPAGNMPELIEGRLKDLMEAGSVGDDFEYYDLGGLLLGREFAEDLKRIDIYGQASSYRGEVLIVHGDKDLAVPLSASYRYMSIYGEQGELYVIEGADHTFNKFEWESIAIERTTDFLSNNK